MTKLFNLSLFLMKRSPLFESNLYQSWWYYISFPVETKAKLLPKCNTYPGFHSEFSTFSKYTGWFNPEVFYTMKYLSKTVVHFHEHMKNKLKVNKELCDLSLGIFITPFCLLSMTFKVQLDLSTTVCIVSLCGIPVICFLL